MSRGGKRLKAKMKMGANAVMWKQGDPSKADFLQIVM
jgi:hypothetical protein